MQRVTLEDVLAGDKAPGQENIHAVRQIDSLRRIAVALDQIVNRTTDAVSKGRFNDEVRSVNADDIAEAKRHVAILTSGAAVAAEMVRLMVAQLKPLDKKPPTEDKSEAAPQGS